MFHISLNIKLLVCIYAFILLIACGIYEYPNKKADAMLYILNTIPMANRYCHEVFVNDEKVASLLGRQYTRLQLRPGVYNVRVSGTQSIGRSLSLNEVKLEAGDKRYLVYDEERDQTYLLEYGEGHAQRWLKGAYFARPYRLGCLG